MAGSIEYSFGSVLLLFASFHAVLNVCHKGQSRTRRDQTDTKSPLFEFKFNHTTLSGTPYRDIEVSIKSDCEL